MRAMRSRVRREASKLPSCCSTAATSNRQSNSSTTPTGNSSPRYGTSARRKPRRPSDSSLQYRHGLWPIRHRHSGDSGTDCGVRECSAKQRGARSMSMSNLFAAILLFSSPGCPREEPYCITPTTYVEINLTLVADTQPLHDDTDK